MRRVKVFIFIAFAVLAAASEAEDVDQKKRGTNKPSNVNTIPTGAQKDYTYTIYTQNPQSSPSQNYNQNQIQNSFYPSQNPAPTNQYYSSYNQPETQQYQAQPQINLVPPSTNHQFVPINLINPGYQSKYQLIPSKQANGQIQIALIPQSSIFQSPVGAFPQSLFTPTPQLNSQSILNQPFNPNYQFNPSMLLVPQFNPLSNYLYPSPSQHLFYQNPASKYNLIFQSPSLGSQQEYEKGPVIKDENDLSVQNEYVTRGVNSYKS